MKKNNIIIVAAVSLAVIIGIVVYLNKAYAIESTSKKNFTFIPEIKDPRIIKVLNEEEDSKIICTTTEKEWAPGDDESILLDPIANIYVGNVLSAKSIQDGSYVAIGDSASRLPVTISIDQDNRSILQATVKHPSLSSIRQGINTIIESPAKGTGIPKLTVKAEQIGSREQLEIYLQGKYSGSGTNIAASFGSMSDVTKKYFLINITQIYYTISTNDITPTGFFRKKPFNIDNTFPVYVQSVNYGRRIWIIYETSISSKITSADLKAQFSFFSGKIETNNSILLKDEANHSSIKALVVGGSLESIKYIPTSISDLSSLERLLTTGLVYSDTTRGAPLSYTLKNCMDGKTFRIVNAGKFTVRDCVVKDEKEETIFASKLPSLEHLCAFHTGPGDRNFDGDCDITFSMVLTFDKNIIYASATAYWKEIDGDSQGKMVLERREIAKLPSNYVIQRITSAVSGDIGAGKHAQKNTVTSFDPSGQPSPFSKVYIIGDKSGNDNMPGPCQDDIHAQVYKIDMNDIKVVYTLTKKQA